MKLKKFFVFPLLVISFFTLHIDGKIEIIKSKKKGSIIKSSTCPVKDGKNLLKPVPVKYLKPSQSKNIFKELVNGDTKFPKNKWTFKKGKALTGKLFIDSYASKFRRAHVSGAQISLRYKKGAKDPKNLRWIQMINTDKPMKKAKPPYIDPFPNDDKNFKAGTSLPFYYTNGEIKKRRNGKNKYGKFDLRFYDFSSRNHPPTSDATWTADLYIASWDSKKNIVIIHDGIKWGWKAGCKKKKKKKKPKSAVPAPKGSRLVVPKIVIAGYAATASVIGSSGGKLGNILLKAGKRLCTTDKDGKARFKVEENVETINVEIVSLQLVSTEPITVITPGDLGNDFFSKGTKPFIKESPGYVTPVEEITLRGGPFSEILGENIAKLGDTLLPVIAGSPAELILRLPPTLPVGKDLPFSVTTPSGRSNQVNVRCVRFKLEADMTRLFKGQGTKGRLIIVGTHKKVLAEIKNLTPGIISMKGGNVIRRMTSGGKKNGIKISFKGIHKGRFHITAKILDKILFKK